MKKIIIIFLLLANYVQAQNNFKTDKQVISVSFDLQLVTRGAYDYDHTPVLDFRFSWVTLIKDSYEMGTYFEYVHLNPKYFDMGFMYNKKIHLLGNSIETLVGGEVSILVRQFDGYETQKAFISYGLNAITRFHLSDWFSLDARANLKYRTDLVKHYNTNVTFDVLGDSAVKLSGMVGVSVYF